MSPWWVVGNFKRNGEHWMLCHHYTGQGILAPYSTPAGYFNGYDVPIGGIWYPTLEEARAAAMGGDAR